MSKNDIELTPLQRRVLKALYDPENKKSLQLRGSEIAKRLGISIKELESLVTFLECTGYIEKCEKSSRVE